MPWRIARPWRIRSRQLSPDRLRNAAALRADHSSPVTGPARSRRSTSGVRSTRCGTPSTRVVTTVPVTSLARYACLTTSATGLSLVSRNRVPMAIPAAP